MGLHYILLHLILLVELELLLYIMHHLVIAIIAYFIYYLVKLSYTLAIGTQCITLHVWVLPIINITTFVNLLDRNF